MKAFFLIFSLVALFTTGCGDAASCQPGGCDDANPCTEDTCDVASGVCQSQPSLGGLCDADGAVGVCLEGACARQSCEGVDCDDENPCTVDGCAEELGACLGVVVPDMTICEVDGVFGRCVRAECDLTLPPTGTAEFSLTIEDVVATSVAYDISCPADITLSGRLTESDGRWTASLTLPAGQCAISLSVFDEDGEMICDGQDTVTILPGEMSTLIAVLTCNE